MKERKKEKKKKRKKERKKEKIKERKKERKNRSVIAQMVTLMSHDLESWVGMCWVGCM